MKRILILYLAVFCTCFSYAQTKTFPIECLSYLRDFARNFATTNLRTPCTQWTGGCAETDVLTRTGGVMIGAHQLGELRVGTTEGVKLAVTQGVISTSLRVVDASKGWPDYVFEKNYGLMPLSEVKAFIATNKHLPNTPSEAEVKKEGGFGVGSVLVNHQEKIEEIFLHLISLKEQADKLNQEFAILSKEETSLQLLFLEKLLERKQKHLEK